MTTHHTAQGLASLGRHGDTMLVHMSPHEVAGLNYLAKKQGTKLTINPDTGLPEAFSLGGLFGSILPMFAGAMFPGAGFAMQPLLAGALTGGVLAKVQGKDPLMGGLMGGLGGISGSNLAQGLGGAASNVAAGGSTPYSLAGGYVDPSTVGAMVGPQAPGATLANTGLQSSQSMMMSPVVRNAVQATQQAGGILPNTGSFLDKELTALSNAGRGAGNLVTGQPGAWEGFKNAFIDPKTGAGALTNTQAALKIGMPVGGALLGGLEPSDIYGEPMKPSDKDRYDPYSRLNLGNDTGLRLVAEGGYINSKDYALGGTVTTGGLKDLYATTDSPTNPQLSRDGYGVGRLENLARQQAMTQAQTTGYAMGGPVSFADGGDAMKLTDEITPVDQGMGLSSLMPPATTPPAPGQAMPTGQVQNAAQALSGQASSEGSIIAQVANNLRTDPNYAPKNPIEASIVKQLKGNDQTQQGQGLGSLGAQPSQPMAPTFNPSVAMGPTYYAGINAPRGMAQGGYLNGDGDGMSDSIPATIEGKQPARLADGEFVIPADVVSHLGNGSSKAGSKRLYAMLDKVRHARTGNKKQGKEIKPEKYMPA